MRDCGLSQESVERIAAVMRTWPGHWTMDLVGCGRPAVVLIAAEGDRFAPALHLEQTAHGVVVVAVRWDAPEPLGTYATLEGALACLGAAVGARGPGVASATLN